MHWISGLLVECCVYVWQHLICWELTLNSCMLCTCSAKKDFVLSMTMLVGTTNWVNKGASAGLRRCTSNRLDPTTTIYEYGVCNVTFVLRWHLLTLYNITEPQERLFLKPDLCERTKVAIVKSYMYRGNSPSTTNTWFDRAPSKTMEKQHTYVLSCL